MLKLDNAFFLILYGTEACNFTDGRKIDLLFIWA